MTEAPREDGPSRRVLLAGGGSGGHISPGLAIAERITGLDAASTCLFACSRRRVDADMLTDAGARFQPIDAAPFSPRPRGLARFLRAAMVARRQATALIDRERIDRVVALGGFVAAPVVAAARRRGVPTVLVNLDAVPGKANRWMARHCTTVVSAIPTPDHPAFASRIVGMPVRLAALAGEDAATCRTALGLDPEMRTLLVTGASQGANSINELMIALVASAPTVFRGWQVLHLAGGKDVTGRLAEAYEGAGVSAVVVPFVHRMGHAWGAADLAISRAGASSVAEAAANAVPSIFLPYPWHRDLHQTLNAAPLVEAGGARVVEDGVDPAVNVTRITPVLQELTIDETRRGAMREALRAVGERDAAVTVARMVLA